MTDISGNSKELSPANRQTGFWDRAAGKKGFHHPLNLPLFNSLVSRESRVVELGCGWGRVLGALAADGYADLAGFDPSPGMVERAGREWPGLEIRVWPDGAVPLEDDSVDAVLLFAVLTCVPSDDGQRGLIADASRILRPGGVLYISDYLIQDDERNCQRYERWMPVYGQYGVFRIDDGAVLRHLERGWLDRLVDGFELIALDEIELLTMNGNPARAFQFMGRKRA